MSEPAAATKPRVATTTAGLRATQWSADALPEGTRLTVHALRTADGASVTGYLFRKGGERSVVCSMHPREMVVASYLVPEVLKGGSALWILGPRSVGNDLRLEHETALLDLAAGQVFLREQMNFEHCILQGTSGGGPLAAFYCQQAALPTDRRIKLSPGGRPTGLEQAQLPPADGVILISAHLGQGRLMMNVIDPAVIDESDPLQSDPSLSAFEAANGFRRPPESSSYSGEFLTRYRAAQRARVERIDATAKAMIGRKADARQRARNKGTRDDAILAAYSPIFQIWRTDADPRCFDLSLEPSDRAYGSLWGANPVVSNFGSVGFGRVCTPESWLSNWSALSSNAGTLDCAPAIGQPTLMIEYTGDNSVFPDDADAIFAAIGSHDKTRHRIHGNHHGRPIKDDAPNGQLVAGQRIRDWLEAERFV
jgi:pimeloyl-ACP methyl ester carboxylesterase